MLAVAHGQSPFKRRSAPNNRGTERVDRLVTKETVAISGLAATTRHHSLTAFRETAAATEERDVVRRGQAIGQARGTAVSAHPDSTGEARLFQEKVAAEVSQLAPVPARRLIHFRWCDTLDFGVRGWKGVIDHVTQTRQGVVVTVRMRPYLVSRLAGITDTPDYVVETYLYSNGRLTFLDCSEPVGLNLHGALFGG